MRAAGVDPPRVHDGADVLVADRARLPEAVNRNLGELVEASRSLRRDRELAFYGVEDLTPSDFYRQPDADQARAAAAHGRQGRSAPRVIAPPRNERLFVRDRRMSRSPRRGPARGP